MLNIGGTIGGATPSMLINTVRIFNGVALAAMTLIFFSPLPLNGQMQVYQFTEKGLRVKDFESITDNQGNIAVMYTALEKAPQAAYSSFQTNFRFFSSSGMRKLTVRGKAKLLGAGYSVNSFFFLLNIPGDDYITIVEMDKEGKTILGSHQLSLNEQLVSLFVDEGTVYLCTLLKSTNEVRIRLVKGAKDPITFTYKISEGLFEELEDRGKFAFVHDRFELSVDEILSPDKIFLRDSTMWITAVGKADSPKKTLRFLELSLRKTAPGLRLQEIPMIHEDRMGIFPVRDTLYVFQASKESFYLGLVSLKTMQVVKSYSVDGEGKGLLQTRLYKQSGENRPDGTITQPSDTKQMLKKLSAGNPFVYAWSMGTLTRLSIGSFEYPTQGYAGPSLGGPTITTPGGSFTSAGGGMHSFSSVSPDANSTFLYGYLDKQLNLVNADKSFGSVYDKVEEFKKSEAFEEEVGSNATCRSSKAFYLIGFSKKTNTFSVWSWPTP